MNPPGPVPVVVAAAENSTGTAGFDVVVVAAENWQAALAVVAAVDYYFLYL